jgi:hypothetical protein
VLEQLAAAGVTRLLDTGCNNCRFLRLLKGLLPGAAYLAGLDLDRELLEAEARVLRPLPGEWLTRREAPLTVELFHGSCGDAAGAGALQDSGVEAVTSIELVEHLDPDTLTTFPAAVLGVIRPRLWVVTTPNSDYNVLFPDFPGPFRHWDHRFEWSRREFQAWAGGVVASHPGYTVRFLGAGWSAGREESHGPASQVAVFTREGPPGPLGPGPGPGGWWRLERVDYPVRRPETRGREELLGDELLYYLRLLVWDQRGEEGGAEVPLHRLLQFDSVSSLTVDVGEAAGVLRGRGLAVDMERMVVVAEQELEPESEEE